MSPLELSGDAFGLICVWLTARENVWCWPTGIVNVILFFVLFARARLFADSGLQLVYLGLSIYGWYYWVHPVAGRAEPPVTRMSSRGWIAAAIAFAAGTVLLRLLLVAAKDAFPLADAATTVSSLVAQWMLTRKVLENWYVWIATDVVYVVMYARKGLWGTGALYLVFIVLCISGIRRWRTRAV